jgi:hypothetical protein
MFVYPGALRECSINTTLSKLFAFISSLMYILLPPPPLPFLKKWCCSERMFAFSSPSPVEDHDDIYRHMGSLNFESGLLEEAMCLDLALSTPQDSTRLVVLESDFKHTYERPFLLCLSYSKTTQQIHVCFPTF